MQIYNHIEFASDPTIAAISVLLIVFTTGVVLLWSAWSASPGSCRLAGKETLMTPCSFGINGGEFPHWPVAEICDLAVKVRAQFVELSSRRIAGEGTAAVGKELAAHGLRAHVNAGAADLTAGFEVARALALRSSWCSTMRSSGWTAAGGRASTISVRRCAA